MYIFTELFLPSIDNNFRQTEQFRIVLIYGEMTIFVLRLVYRVKF